MKKYILLYFFLIGFLNNSKAQVINQIDVVYLLNGNKVKGFIIEDTPNVEIKFKTLDGSIIIYSYNDFSKLEKEQYTGRNTSQERVMYDNETFITGGIALNSSQRSGFIMVGKVKTFGGYFKLKSNLNFNYSSANQVDDIYTRYWSGTEYKGRLGFTAGGLVRVSKSLFIYAGAGYGSYWVDWETSSGERVRIASLSSSGLEFETGLNLKLGNKFLINAGASSSTLLDIELNMGIGISF